LLSATLRAQEIPVGTWRLHPAYQNGVALADAGERVYVAATNGLFSLQKTDRQLATYSKVDGLSGNEFAALAWDAPRQALLIAYTDGNLDFLTEAEIVNLRAIADSRQSDRRVYHLQTAGNLAYVATGFGLVVLNLARREVAETYVRIGPGGSEVAVFASATARDSLFVASSQGLLAASLAPGVNRLDFRNWRRVPTPGGLPRTLAARGGSLFLGVDGRDAYEYDGRSFRALGLTGRSFTHLAAANNLVTFCTGQALFRLGLSGPAQPVSAPLVAAPQQAMADAQGNLWLADAALGLVTNAYGDFQRFTPSGPFSSAAFRLVGLPGQMLALAGGYNRQNYDAAQRTEGFYAFAQGTWRNFNAVDTRLGSVRIPPARDWVDAAYAPATNRVYLASYQNGLLEWDLANDNFRFLNAEVPGLGPSVAAVATDAAGQLWAGAFGLRSGQPSVFRRGGAGSWQGFALPGFNGGNVAELVPDAAGNVWARLAPFVGGGLVVLGPDGRTRRLSAERGQGNLPSANVTCLALDQEGTMWVGTDNGLGLFFGAAGVLDRPTDAARAVLDNRELLRGEAINCLAVDGGNRKWVGTNAGVWLFSADGSEVLARFTAANSPLPSNLVRSVAIVDQTGEVFFATEAGLASYRGLATAPAPDLAGLRIFPNPVPPGYGGLLTIDGLVANARVKITDVAGRLVFETNANGGSATWTGADYRGQRARPGVYLVYASAAEGTPRLVGKFLWMD
jgi:ligand-binding sensor domain-containing protein